MKLEYMGSAAAVHAFSDLVITTDNNELLYASFKGYDSAIQAMKAACHSKKSESFYLYPTPDCPNILGSGKTHQWIQVIGSFHAFVTKEEDLSHAEMVSEACLENATNPVVLAWDGDLLKAFSLRIEKTHPFPLRDEWMAYLYGKLERLGKIEVCKVFTTTEINLSAFRLTATPEEIENIVLDGFKKGVLSIPDGEAGDASIDQCVTVTDYLQSYGRALAKNLSNIFEPRHRPGDSINPKIHELLRKPYQAQADVANGLALTLEEKQSAMCIAEMGTGKTFISLAVAHLIGAKDVLVMCPGHLKGKWKREIEITIPNAEVFFIDRYQDVFKIREVLEQKVDHPRYFVISKDTAKLSFFKRRAARWSNRLQGWICPDCGALQVEERGRKGEKESFPLEYEDFEHETAVNSKCCACGTKLWTADNQMACRVAPADLVKKYLKGQFDLFIADELHQFKGDSAQGNAFGSFMGVAKRTLGLTGTLLGGYASNLYRILFRMNPQAFLAKGMDFHSVAKFVSQYGVLERTYKNEDSAKNRASKGTQRQVSVKERPGISPKVFGEFLLDRCAFLRLTDVTNELPNYTEKVELIEMDPELEDAYNHIAVKLKAYVDEVMRWGSNAGLGVYLTNLLSYPDKPFGNTDILKPGTEEVLVTPQELDDNVLYSKEERLIELVKEHKKRGRKCLIFASYTGKKDVTNRMKEVLAHEGIKVAILRSSVKPEQREEWLADKVYRGYDAVIANPTLVETGLDCIDFPTIVFAQTGYNLFTLRQASRRSWRIGQGEEVEVYFLAYADTLQEAAIRLMGAKMEASLSLEGEFSEEGLRMMGSGTGQDLGTALAKALVQGLDGIDSAEEIWGRMGYGTIASHEIPENPLVLPLSQATSEGVPVNSIRIVEVKRVSSKKRKAENEAVQLGWDFDLLGA